jgi:hypothetical protein
MRTSTLRLALILGIALAAAPAGATTRDDFLVETTEDIIELCTTPEGEDIHEEAVSFCYGFLVGAYRYYQATLEGPEARPLFCMGGTPPTRQEAITAYIEWAKANPQYLQDAPVHTLFKHLIDKYPCPEEKKPAATKGATKKTGGSGR